LLSSKRLFLTGPPGSGKTTIVRMIMKTLESEGCRLGGIYAPEVRERGRRVGFKLCTIPGESCKRLAWVECPSPYRVGKYGVCVEEVREIARRLLEIAASHDVIVIDEIGPMELAVDTLRNVIVNILEGRKPIVGVVHRALKSRDPEIYSLIRRESIIIWVDPMRREEAMREALEAAKVIAGEACRTKGGEGTT
jgi:nucleoside-triphosphatase